MSYGGQMAIEEFIDVIATRLSYACGVPNRLPMVLVRQFIETEALQTFYDIYQYALSKMYFFLDKKSFQMEEYTGYGYLTLPCEIQSISWIYQCNDVNLFSLGINTPNMSVNLGVTNQPYMSSYLSTIGGLGEYKTLLDNFADQLNQLNKYTHKFHFNRLTHRLNILTNIEKHLILECYVGIPKENLFTDPLFIRYVLGWSKIQLGNMLGMLDMPLPGNVKFNTADLVSQGQLEMDKVIEEIKGQCTTSWFIMKKG